MTDSSPQLAFFGELILRLSTQGAPILDTRALDLYPAGAEANVAIGLAHLGHATRMITRVPDNDLGRVALRQLKSAGVDCSRVSTGPGRMALYFLTPGMGIRASEIVYDRQDSAFARAIVGDFDFPALLAGATHLHLSGITPALGPNSTEVALAAARAAKELGIAVIFDGNYRGSLWGLWDSDPRSALSQLVSLADIMFGNHRDITLLLGKEFSGSGTDRRREAAEAAFAAFPNLKLLASTARHVETATRNTLSARIDTPAGWAETGELLMTDIVDRIGGGDAFAAGVLHAMLNDPDDLQAMAESGLALSALKHTLPGDASVFNQRDLANFRSGNLDVRR